MTLNLKNTKRLKFGKQVRVTGIYWLILVSLLGFIVQKHSNKAHQLQIEVSNVLR
ncbi:hypothetical protein L4D20_11780 [Vibrio kyushuensis]|uniref:hypothetical protein n=1 Tax=Vibrio kyushuensis TaxID=2910249 RepID=UPI003D0DFD39